VGRAGGGWGGFGGQRIKGCSDLGLLEQELNADSKGALGIGKWRT
jgi:hypothetical protein